MTQIVTVDPNTIGRTNFFQTPPGHSDYASIVQAPGMATGIKAFRCFIQTGITGTSSGDDPGDDPVGSPNGKNRVEALIAGGQVGSAAQDFSIGSGPGYDPSPGDTWWHRWRFRVESGSQLPSTATWNWHMTQTNSLDSGSHYGGMSLKKDLNAVVFENPGTVWTLPTTSFQMDRWYDIIWKVTFQTGASGTHTMWVDGVQQQTATGATMKSGGVYHKFGIYRNDPGVAGHVTLFHSGLWVATTRAELDNVIPGVTDGTGGTPQSATVTYNWVGNVSSTGATVSTKFGNLAGGETARLAVSTSSAMTSPTYGTSQTVDANGYAKLPAPSLSASTTYFYGVSINNGSASNLGSFKTFPASGTQTSFTFGFASCANADSAALPLLRNRNPAFFLHMGDLGYFDITTNTPASFRSAIDGVMQRTNHKPFFTNIPTAYTWSDHDWAANDSNGTAASGPAAQSVYRQVVPHYTLGSSDGQGIYQTFVYGRVRFILTDLRSYKSAQSATDNSSKTMMGATQKTWFKNLITSSTEQAIVWVCELPWIQTTTAGEDQWGGYNTERQELATYISGSGKHVVIVSGDMHALGFDSGTNSAGGIPVFQAAPLHQAASVKGGPYSGGTYPTSGSAVVEQYGHMTVTDSGTAIQFAFKGYDAADTQRMSGVVSFDLSGGGGGGGGGTPLDPRAKMFDSTTNPSISLTNFAPFTGMERSPNGSIQWLTTAATGKNHTAIRFRTVDSSNVADYYVNTFDNPDTLTSRMQLETPETLSDGRNVAWFGLERWFVWRARHNFPILGTPTNTPAPYANGVAFAGFGSNYGQPFGGSSGNGTAFENNSNGTDLNVRFKTWSALAPRNEWVTVIFHRKFNSSVSAVDGWDEVYYARDGFPATKVTFSDGTQRYTSAQIRAGVNDGAPNDWRMSNYHRALMPAWVPGDWHIDLIGFVYDAAYVNDVSDIDPYYIYDAGTAPPPPPPPGGSTPSTPTNLTATSSGATVTLNWDDSPDPAFSYFAVRWSNDASIDPSQWTRISSGGPQNNGNLTASALTFTAATSGTYQFYITEVTTTNLLSDRSNIVSVPVQIGTTADPETTITSPADGDTFTTVSPTVTFASSIPNSVFQGRVDGGTFVPVTSPWVLSPLINGDHTVEVFATAPDGSDDPTPASVTFTIQTVTVDTTPPNTTITAPVTGASVSATPTVSFFADEPATFEIKIDAGNFTPASSPYAITNPLTPGTHTVQVRAIDLAGNTDTTPASVSFSVAAVDTQPPQPAVTYPPNNATVTSNTPVIAFASNEASTFEVSVDNGPYVYVGSASVWSVTPALQDGTHTVKVVATDVQGNRSDAAPASVTFNVQTGVTSNAEQVILNGIDLSPDTGAPYWLESFDAPPPAERQDWVGSADSEYAVPSRMPAHENRTITMTVRVSPQATMDSALAFLGVIVDELRAASTQGGIPLEWCPSGSTKFVTFTVLAGQVSELPIDAAWSVGNAPAVTITLTCKPYWEGSEVAGAPVTSTSPLGSVIVNNVPGDQPALGRLIVSDTAGQARRHVEWGLENQYYDPSDPSPLLIDSAQMTTANMSGFATTLAGAYGTGTNAIQAGLSINPVAVCGIPSLGHTGAFRIRARFRFATTSTFVRLSWRAGDAPLTANPWVTAPRTGFMDRDLGTITIPAQFSGVQSWSGQIEAYESDATALTTQLHVDFVEIIPITEGYGKAYSVPVKATISQSTSAFDSFAGTTAGGVLAGRTAPNGGTWSSAGSTGDFAFTDSPTETIQRTAVSETGGGRVAVLGSTSLTDTNAVAMIGITAPNTVGTTAAPLRTGVVIRYKDASNYLRAVYRLANNAAELALEQVINGVVSTLAATTLQQRMTATFQPLSVNVYTSGLIVASLYDRSRETVQATSPALATGGTLAAGRFGVFDYSQAATATTRQVWVFYAGVAIPESVVINPNKSLEITSEDVLRVDASGSVFGRPGAYRGSRFLVPPGSSRIAVKARRNNVEADADDFVQDATQYQVAFTPRGLVVPR
jgi:hypothetical protein